MTVASGHFSIGGVLTPLYDAIAWVIMHIHAVLAVPFGADSGAAWALSIVLLVIFLRLIMLPLFIKQVHSQQRMQAHMPQLQELRKKYKNDKQKLNEETMKYYRENGVNPLSGCLPLLAQFPVFISLFSVLKAIADWTPPAAGHAPTPPPYGLTIPVVESARKATVFGVHLYDTFLHSSTPWSVRGVILVSVLISAATTYLTMRQSMKRGMMQQGPVDPDNPMAQSQKMMVYIAPLFALSGLYWGYGLVIYWVTNNLWTFGQQYFLFRNLPIVGSATVDAAVDQPSTRFKPSTATTKAGQTGQSSRVAQSARAGQPARAGQAGKAGQPAKATSASGKSQPPGSAARTSSTAGASAKAKPSASTAGPATAETGATAGNQGVNGSSAAGASGAQGGAQGVARSLLRRSKDKPEPEPAVPQKATVRQQPVRSTRSKRSGKR
jgi:YidC/Oxa1 family membrane protein insertase